YLEQSRSRHESLMVRRNLQSQHNRKDLLNCIDAGQNLLAVFWQCGAASDRHTAKTAVTAGDVDPVKIMQVQHRARRHLHARLESSAMDRRRSKHPNAHQRIRILHLNTYFRGPNLRIEDCANVADDASEDAVGVSIQANIHLLTQTHFGKIILVDIAYDPDMRKIGDRKGS